MELGDHRNGRRMSILMLPWLAHGHVSPFFELAKLLAAKNFHVFFCSTAVNLRSVQPKLTPNLETVELRLPASPELPPDRHTTAGLPPHLMFSLKGAFDAAAPAFAAVLRRLAPDLLIYDFLQPWAPAEAAAAGIPAVMFNNTSALMPATVLHILEFQSAELFSLFPEIRCSEYEIRQLKNFFGSSVNDAKDKERVVGCWERSCGIVLVKSFREIEGKYIDFLSTLLHKKVIPVGPLVEEPEDDGVSSTFEEWLNKKDESSSILVSFGSEFYLSKQDMEEIAYGLELSHVNFIWVVRFAVGGGERKKAMEEELPKGFLERVKDRGMVVEGWAPQTQILRHRSTGGFLSHCGWSSVLESIKFGVPIIAAPMHLDQPLNARLIECLDVSIIVERGGSNGGSLRRGEVARAIKEVVVDKSGERMRKKAKELAKMMKKKGNEEMEVVVEELVKLV
ncbi:beta-D-glucosyl crocetin beta-1,6-glucosyltransferase-like [Momordica charantia]|uniref:Glycosyltransferase n=1 Tax=Momordica charantia TaxID=3673 RepID=A0A6J1BWM7_MOMCH|nr:beta-D-glucosyl crocetin beta-1,6-glucosyltransferase-like [Momordica charantia]